MLPPERAAPYSIYQYTQSHFEDNTFTNNNLRIVTTQAPNTAYQTKTKNKNPSYNLIGPDSSHMGHNMKIPNHLQAPNQSSHHNEHPLIFLDHTRTQCPIPQPPYLRHFDSPLLK